MKEKHRETIIKNIDDAFDNTCYGYSDVKRMKENSIFMFNRIFDFNGTKYLLEEENKEVEIKITGYKFGHNDFQILYNDFDTYRALKEIFRALKEKEFIGNFSGNGYGTAFVLSYESTKSLDIF